MAADPTPPADAPARPPLSNAAALWAFAYFLLLVFGVVWSGNIYLWFANEFAHSDGPRNKPDPKREDPAELGAPLGVDFAQFVAIARAWQTGRIAGVYDFEAQGQLVREVGEYPEGTRPPYDVRSLTFSYPPFFLWLPRLLVGLPYKTAFFAWWGLQFAFLALALAAWRAQLAGRPVLFRLVVLSFLAFPPVAINVIAGQCAFLALAALSGTFLFLNRGRDFLAGLCLSVLFYKPTFGVLLGPILLLLGRWRLVGGVAAGGLVLIAASLAVAGPSLLPEWPKVLGELRRFASTQPAYFSKHFNWLSFVSNVWSAPHQDGVYRALPPALFTPAMWLMWFVPVAGVAAALVSAWWQPWRPGSPRFAACCSATVLATLFVSPYLFYYDVLVLGVCMVYTGMTLRLRPAWHSWAVLLSALVVTVFVGGNTLILAYLPVELHLRLAMEQTAYTLFWLPLKWQLAPVGMLAWFAVEVVAARTLPATFDFKDETTSVEKRGLLGGEN